MTTNEDADPDRTRSDMSPQNRRIADKLTTAFDQSLQKGEQPRIEVYLAESPQVIRAELLQSLLRIELATRIKRGKLLPAGEYVARFPDYASMVGSIYEETVGASKSSTEIQPESWFYLRNNIRVGPFTFEQLRQIVRAGDLRPKDRVASGSTGDWGEAGSIGGLFPRPGESGGLKAPAPGDGVRNDYILLERVGRGGMGDVFKAYRFSLKQEVAFKIVRHDRFARLSPAKQNEVLEAFRTEMQATANLRHDNIITIFDNGDHNGLPFYTMNFVEKSLANILHHGPLDGQKAAEYIQKIALAVDHANDKGLIHRDIKPANILLDKQKCLLTDLGLATTEQLLEPQGRGQVAGTPPYMAPEQVRGDKLDKRTDVYGLGATLYCLITGKPPHQGSNWQQIREQVEFAEPLAPRKLNPSVDRNLEAITLKCLEKEPDKRYPSAGALAEDLDRYLTDRPVSAKIPYFWERLYKWARRERIKAGLVAAILCLLFLFVVNHYWSNWQLSAALDTAKGDRATAEQARGLAQSERDRAEGLAKEAGREKDQAEQARQKARDMASLLGMRVFRKYETQTTDDLVKQAQFSEALLKKDPRDEIKRDLADTYQDLVNHALKSNQRKEATAYLRQCIVLLEDLAEKAPILKFELGLNYLDLGSLYGELGNPIQEIVSDTKALDILKEARKLGYNETVVLAAIAQTHVSLGIDFRKKGERKKALEHQREAVRILEQLNSGDKNALTMSTFLIKLGKAYHELGISVGSTEAAEAPAYFEKAIKIFAGKSQYRRNLASANLGLGNAFLDQKDKDHAIEPLEKAYLLTVQLLKDLPPNGPQTETVRLVQAQSLSSQGKAYHLKPEPDPKKAETLFQQSLEIRKELAAQSGKAFILVDGLADWAEFHVKEGNIAEAIDHYDQAILHQEKYIKDAPEDYPRRRIAGVLLYNKALYLSKNGKHDEALDSLRKAKEHETEAYRLGGGESYKEYLYMTHKNLFVAQMNLKRYGEAIDTIEERIKFWPKDEKKYLEAAVNLAAIYQRDSSDKTSNRIYAFFQRALEQKMLNGQELRQDSRFRNLAADPAFEKLLAK